MCFNACIPRRIFALCVNALLQQSDDFARKVAKVYQNALLNLQALKLFFTDLQGMQEEQIFITRKVNPEYLKATSPVRVSRPVAASESASLVQHDGSL